VTLPAGLQGAPIAHRGLWRTGAAPENSLAAFEAACAAGYGVELDVRLSADGEAMVFHDDTLERLTAESGLVEERTAQDLQATRLLGSDQFIPSLDQVLRRIDGRALVLIELKTPVGQEGLLERRVAEIISDYEGSFGLLSFNADALAWMAGHAPYWPRGLNAHTAEQLAAAPLCQADFLSVSLALADHPRVRAWRQDGKAIAWTARARSEFKAAQALVDNVVFEGFAP
jgi:glycerophosphoryl diester phosphodiesterase